MGACVMTVQDRVVSVISPECQVVYDVGSLSRRLCLDMLYGCSGAYPQPVTVFYNGTAVLNPNHDRTMTEPEPEPWL